MTEDSSTPRLNWLLMAAHVPDGGAGGGMVRYVVELATALNSRPDVEVHVMASRTAARWWRDRLGADQVHTVADLPPAVAGVRDVAGWAVPHWPRFDVVHGTKHLLPSRGVRGSQVLTVHDMLPLDRPRDFGAAKRLLLRRPYLRALARADLLLCVSEASRHRLLSYLPQVAGRTGVVPLAPPTALVDAASRPVAALRSGRFVLTVGDNSPRKNLTTLLESWRRVQPNIPDTVLALAGPAGWGVTAGTDSTPPGVVRLGHIDDGQLRWCYQNAAAIAVPSLLEGFGLPAAEARAFGTPLITSDDPALAEAAQGAAVVTANTSTAWSRALLTTLRAARSGGRDRGRPDRDWADVAADTVRAVREVSLMQIEGACHV